MVADVQYPHILNARKVNLILPCPLRERRVNEVIQRNLDVTTEFITQQEAAQRFDMKRLPEGASDTVRVVHVGDYDQCLCIGLHVANTSEIGTFKITTHSYADGIFRIRFKLEK